MFESLLIIIKWNLNLEYFIRPKKKNHVYYKKYVLKENYD